jgi:hypothetical protein
MDVGQFAALIAAGSCVVLACAGVVVLLRLARLLTAAIAMVADYRERTDRLIEQAQAAVDRTNEQLLRTDSITASMDQVTANMAELSGHVSALTGLARGVADIAGGPVTGLAAFVYGLRRAVLVRRAVQVAAVAHGRAAPAAITGVVSAGGGRSKAVQ